MLKYIALFILLCGCTIRQPTYVGGAVAADHVLASKAGVEILQQGGNAVDAAVATSFALSVVRPFSCGIGGGGFMIIDSPAMEPVALNYRETTPRSVDPTFFEHNSSRFGGSAVGIPGTVAGLLAAHERYGILPIEKVLAPAIRLARDGFSVDNAFSNAVSSALKSIEKLPLKQQRKFVLGLRSLTHQAEHGNIAQSRVLEQIAQDGLDGFYRGDVAKAIVLATSNHISLDDLASYTPRWEKPIHIDLGYGDTIISMPPPSSGGVAIAQILGLLTRLDAQTYAEGSVEFTQLLIESMQHAFADRAEHLADAEFVDVPVQKLLEDAYLDELAQRIVLGKTQETYTYGSVSPQPDDDGTSHFCVVDKDGMMVSATETINTSFGSLVLVEPYGFMLNNEMDDFSSPNGANVYGLRQSDNNLPEPGKRPLSSMTPTIVEHEGTPFLALGASGGPRIISSVVQVLLQILWFGNEPTEALSGGRVHHQWLPQIVYVEKEYRNNALETYLAKIGYEIRPRSNIGVVQVILLDEGLMKPASDPRKGGKHAGY